MRDQRGHWYLLTGLVIGIALGLVYAWVLEPVQYTNTGPASLRSDYKDQYRALIAAAYASNNDLVRARARLELLKDADLYRALAEQAQRMLAAGASLEEARALGQLAVALGRSSDQKSAEPGPTYTSILQTSPSPELTVSPTILSATQTSGSASNLTSPSRTPPAALTATSLPTRTPTPTPGAPYVLASQDLVCEAGLQSLIQVIALNTAGQGVTGVEAIVSWDAGEDHFFTGLKPELGPGYADFSMTPGVSYTLRLADGGQLVSNLAAVECENARGERQWGSWKVEFTQP